mmetsp:Transcript_13251/g.25393  ORF Transcript_13251/g.25393 Transcript_13251/m.25393 type:complete len:376 (+) Transcript_13251:940-2067(+)
MRHAVAHHKHSQVANTRALLDNVEAFPKAALGLALLGGGGHRNGGAPVQHTLGSHHHHAHAHHRPNQQLQRRVQRSRGKVVEELDVRPRRHLCHVGKDAHEGIHRLGLFPVAHLVRHAPRQQRDDDGAPELGHAKEQRKGPVLEAVHQPQQRRAGHQLREPVQVQRLVEGEGGQEEQVARQETGNHDVKDARRVHRVAELGVAGGEGDGHGQHHVGAQEGEHLRAPGRDHQGVLQVLQDGEVEGGAEEHHRQGEHLAAQQRRLVRNVHVLKGVQRDLRVLPALPPRFSLAELQKAGVGLGPGGGHGKGKNRQLAGLLRLLRLVLGRGILAVAATTTAIRGGGGAVCRWRSLGLPILARRLGAHADSYAGAQAVVV